MRRVISIQSQVVHGHVGNSAAVFPMQARGIDVAAVPTTLLSNHPHYPTMYGQVLEPGLVADLLRCVEDRGWIDSGAILLTGYLGSVAIAEVVIDFIARAQRRNPNLIYVCDPVMGDDDLGIFAAPGLPEIFRDRLVPAASVITPNQFELELLTGAKARSVAALREAARALSANGTGAIIVTGVALDDTPPDHTETVLCLADTLHRVPNPRLPIRPSGTGDLFAALLVAELCNGSSLATSVNAASQYIFAILQRTLIARSKEMLIVATETGSRAAGQNTTDWSISVVPQGGL